VKNLDLDLAISTNAKPGVIAWVCWPASATWATPPGSWRTAGVSRLVREQTTGCVPHQPAHAGRSPGVAGAGFAPALSAGL